MFVCAASVVASILAQPASPTSPTEWIQSNAVAFTTPVAGSGFDDLKGLDAIIGDARIVSLGEPTHGTREAFQFKHRLIEYLVERKGFTVFSIEASMPESFKLNEYIIDGKGDPKALIAGMYFWTWRTEEVLAMVEWMRDWNQKHPPTPTTAGKPPLRFTGFDMQTPDVAGQLAIDFAASHAPDLKDRLTESLKNVKRVAQRASLGGTQSGFMSATGSFPVEAAAGKKLTFSVWIRTEGVSGWAGGWWRCDTPAGVNGFENLQKESITGTTPWTRHEFTLDVPKDTQNINFGFLLNGDGAAWFDDVEISLDGVKYDNPKAFSFDFEDDAVKFLMGGSGEYALSRSTTSPHAGKKCLEIRRRPESEIGTVDVPKTLAEAEALVAELTSRRSDLVKKVPAKDVDWAIQNARIVAQGAKMYGSDDGFNVRDESMAANVRWIGDQHPGEKMILWAHNGHVSRAGYMSMVSMGSHLSKAYGKDMVVFGFATGQGTYTAMSGMSAGALTHDNPLAEIPETSVEAFFATAGLPNAILDLRGSKAGDPASGWPRDRRPMRSIGALATPQQFFPCVPAEMFDVLVWQSQTTASRTLTP